jgi:hypothetical protein
MAPLAITKAQNEDKADNQQASDEAVNNPDE